MGQHFNGFAATHWCRSTPVLEGCFPYDSGERLNGIQEVSGSIPLISTMRGFLTENSFPFGNEFFALCGLFTEVYSLPELFKVNVKLNVEFIAFVNIYPLY